MNGFTLIETLISLAIVVTISVIGFGSGIDSYEQELARSHQTSLFWQILQARAASMTGLCDATLCVIGISHGVSLDATHQVAFSPLSGLVSNPQNVLLGNGTLSVNSEGQVSLTP
jgi:prepilin-type N-terminal cleavage/methylation domain-containing protein